MPLSLFAWPDAGHAGNHTLCAGEREAAETTRQRIDNEWPLRGSGDAVTSYVQSLGIRVIRGIGPSRSIDWHFHVVRDRAVNAFSIGAGHVLITDGAVNFVQNESELAGILAHEIGHELAGHFCSSSPPPSLFDDFFDGPGTHSEKQVMGVGSLTQVIDPNKERQADEIAVRILEAGGFDPRAMLSLTHRLQSVGAPTHLLDPRRMQALESFLAKTPPAKAQSSEDFQKIKRALAAERAAW